MPWCTLLFTAIIVNVLSTAMPACMLTVENEYQNRTTFLTATEGETHVMQLLTHDQISRCIGNYYTVHLLCPVLLVSLHVLFFFILFCSWCIQ